IGNNDITDVLQSLIMGINPAVPADQILFSAPFQKGSAHISVIGIDSLLQILEGQTARDQGVHISIDLELPHIAAERKHAGDPGYGAELWLDDPVLRGPEFHKRVSAFLFVFYLI